MLKANRTEDAGTLEEPSGRTNIMYVVNFNSDTI